ncbi:hypothetical protein AB0C42_00880 [Micromonospora taraxaci]|uniref:Uncharacterized protein n=1 Tax=Micromonospora taraxaci TaxID=1316803 RepID=A0A561VEX4_9ACTN|nr:hypothetical protein [Micromonospora taraxaci]TWG10170.1 hypothetical protein FHU34_12624 [Micromonospora taraxaci]
MLTAAQVLAENNFGDTRTGGLAGPMGLFLILLLATATILLIRNMNSRLRRLPDQFPQQTGPTDPTRADAAVVDPTDGTGGRDSSTPAPNGHQQHRNG